MVKSKILMKIFGRKIKRMELKWSQINSQQKHQRQLSQKQEKMIYINKKSAKIKY